MKRKASGTKTKGITDTIQVQYTPEHWLLLDEIRKKAITVMEKLAENGIQTIVYGSITRGDVSKTSDIDLFVPYQISSFKIETALQQEGLQVLAKKIIQATPKHLVKAHIYLNEETCITFPLTSMREREFDFIQFGGSLDLKQINEGIRVPGVDKRLILISPMKEGHQESPVVGFESIVAKKIGVNVGLVKERVRVLTTRDKVGRTGVYLDVELALEENIDEIFKGLKDKDPIIRRRAKL
ncbi:MAG: nucleotidyltransferase domain-containing protein [Candidatus Heimdallarchaeota archaeon]|nr:nucleotidyltransferase domain-containing protein [Candidatus Heimdallarchaeota archaeon]MBY8994554.1 nucleotidyltransferase domain-containing protein [Candidatus Heimdallarchaeota archaeon]